MEKIAAQTLKSFTADAIKAHDLLLALLCWIDAQVRILLIVCGNNQRFTTLLDEKLVV